ncbi:TonB-dependent siderophore receptor [Commensalibacter melissae]|uniref:TonB-dependent siderophore receptor n=1 Tax=Commensalibacter melissae TaxID=2070537 RepID=UPI0012D9A3DD|nr:TonB-dependent siderophore receptor [Commensalibacter melissae]MUG80537.1 TonB-dependent siderophore receptor [Commensalibacter melissae]
MRFTHFTVTFSLLIVSTTIFADPIAYSKEDQENKDNEKITVVGKRNYNPFVETNSDVATKTNSPLRKVPQSITIITRKQMDDQNARTVSDALAYSAGISAGSRPGGRFDSIYLRGFGGFGGNANYVQFLDGLRLLRGMSYAVPSFDEYLMQSVEVLRGPASVLYGQASPGGFVNMTMKQARPVDSYEVRASGASFNYGDIMGDAGGSLNKDKTLSYRVTAVGRYGDTQVDFAKERHIAIMPQISWQATDDTSVSMRFLYQYDPNSLYGIALPASGTVLPNRHGKISTHLNTSEPGFDQYHRSQYMFEYNLTHDFTDFIQFNQKFRYLHLDSDFRSISIKGLATDQATVSRMATISNEHLNSYNIDSNLQFHVDTGNVKHILITGIDYLLADSKRALGNTAISSLDLFNPVYGARFTPLITSYGTQSQNQLGVYIQDQANYRNWSFIMGGRYDWIGTSTNFKYGGKSASNFDRAVTYRGGIVYNFQNGISPYFSYSTSFMPTPGTTFAGKAFKPTKGDQYEVGIKYQPNNNIMVTGSAYTISQENVTTTDPEHTTYNIQTGRTRSRGFELEARAILLPGLNLIASYAYNDIQIRADTNKNNIGNRPLGAPANLISGWITYDLQQGMFKGVGIGGGIRYNGYTFGDNANSFKVPSFVIGDMQVHYDLKNSFPTINSTLLQLNVTNVADKKYVVACASKVNCFYGTRRVIMGQVRAQW